MVAVVKHRNERKKWTEKQLIYLEDNYGKRDIEEMSKYLGRSVSAIRNRIGKLLGSQDERFAQGLISTKELASILSVNVGAIRCWIKDYGLPAKKFIRHGKESYVKYSYGIEQDKFWNWLKENRTKVCLDPNKIKRGVIIPEPDWLQQDIVNNVIYGRRKWSKQLENTVWDMFYFNKKSYDEIAKETGLSYDSIKGKIAHMQKKKVAEAKKKRKAS